MASKPGQAASQALPAKEAGLFKQVIKLYEAKQYKKGVKVADQVRDSPPVACGLPADCAQRRRAGGTPSARAGPDCSVAHVRCCGPSLLERRS